MCVWLMFHKFFSICIAKCNVYASTGMFNSSDVQCNSRIHVIYQNGCLLFIVLWSTVLFSYVRIHMYVFISSFLGVVISGSSIMWKNTVLLPCALCSQGKTGYQSLQKGFCWPLGSTLLAQLGSVFCITKAVSWPRQKSYPPHKCTCWTFSECR